MVTALTRRTFRDSGRAPEPLESTERLSEIGKETFVWAIEWPDHEQTFKRLQDEPSWETLSVASGHMLQWDVPERCREILEEAAA